MSSRPIPSSSDLNSTWSFVVPGLELIIGGSSGNTSVTPDIYVRVYSAIYNYCVKRSRSPYNFSSSNALSQSSLLVGADIYKKLQDYLKQYVESLTKLDDESYLDFYVRRWTRFTIGARYLNHVFDYMNRYWVQKERSDGRRDIYDVNTLSLLIWKDIIFRPNVDELVKQILQLIKNQRENQVVNQKLLAESIKSFVMLGIDTKDLKKPNLNIYIDEFEKPFLEATRLFYAAESKDYISSHNVVDYMRKAEQRINEEESREATYLNDHSKQPLTDVLNETLIIDHKDKMYEKFKELLDQRQIDHISKMFSLLNRVPKHLGPMAESFSKYIETQGLKSIENLQTDVANSQAQAQQVTGKKSSQGISPKAYIKTLIQVYQTFKVIVDDAFQTSSIFNAALDSACKKFINNNPIASQTKGKSSRTPELLARYSDTLLKKNKDPDAVSGMNSDEVMTVFKFLDDKDVFEYNYRKLLAKRLIHDTSSSLEEEEAMIQKLQGINSTEYAHKLTQMFQDVRISGDLKKELKQEFAKLPADQAKLIVPDFEPLIITERSWPMIHSDDTFQLPNDLQPTYARMEAFYTTKKHKHRALKWKWVFSRGEVRANLAKPGKPSFTFTVSLYQMAILLAFNETDTYTTKELCLLTGLSKAVFTNHMIPMVKLKLFSQSPTGLENIENDETKFKVVREFRSKRLKLSFIPSAKPQELKAEEEEVEKELKADRQFFLQACIVRIMKARRTLSHKTLSNDVFEQSSPRFKPNLRDIKQSIDYLVGQEYLKRNEEKQTYDYVA